MPISFKKLGKGADALNYYSKNLSDSRDVNHKKGYDDYLSKEGKGNFLVFQNSPSLPILNNQPITPALIENLSLGLHPITKQPLIRGASDKHQAGFDLTFTLPKTFSIMWGLLDKNDYRKKQIEEIHEQATQYALLELQNLLYSRKGAGGLEHVAVKTPIITQFKHYTTRELDPNIHTHNIVFNLAENEDGVFRTIDAQQVLKQQAKIKALYHAKVSQLIAEKLGLELNYKSGSCQIAGIDDKVFDAFSKRTQEVKKYCKENGINFEELHPARIKKLFLTLRKSKSSIEEQELNELWKKTAQDAGLLLDNLNSLFNKKYPENYNEKNKKQIMKDSLENSFQPSEEEFRRVLTHMLATTAVKHTSNLIKQQRQINAKDIAVEIIDSIREQIKKEAEKVAIDKVSLFNELKLEISILKELEKRSINPEHYNSIKKEMIDNKMLVHLGKDENGISFYSTPEMVQLEREMLQNATLITDKHIQHDSIVFQKIAEKTTITDEQKNAVLHCVLDNHMVSVVEGTAGAGKSFTMDVVRAIYQENGYKIQGLALSWAAAKVLSESANLEETKAIEGYVRSLKSGEVKLDNKTVILVDEAGLVGSKYMATLFEFAKKAGAKVILTGDSKQLSPVDGGGALEGIVPVIGSARLDEIRRQKQQYQKEAVEYFRDSNALMGLTNYQLNKNITFVSETHKLKESVLTEWNQYRLNNPNNSSLILCANNNQVRSFNEAVRNILKEEGKVKEDALTVKTTDGNNVYEASFSVGDVIAFRKNLKEDKIYNRTQGQIIDIKGTYVTVELENKELFTFKAEKGGYWDEEKNALPVQHAYAMTIYSSQGMTVNQTFVVDDNSIDTKLAYVGMSRHKDNCQIFIDEENSYDNLRKFMSDEDYKSQDSLLKEDFLREVSSRWSKNTKKLITQSILQEFPQQTEQQRILKLNRNIYKRNNLNEIMENNTMNKNSSSYNQIQNQLQFIKTLNAIEVLTSEGIDLAKEGIKTFKSKEKFQGEPYLVFMGKNGDWLIKHGDKGDTKNLVGFIQERNGLSFVEAVNYLSNKENLPLQLKTQPQKQTFNNQQQQIDKIRQQIKENETNFPDNFKKYLNANNQDVIDNINYAYKERDIDAETLEFAMKNKLCEFKKNGIMFTGYDENNNLKMAEIRLRKGKELTTEKGQILTKLSVKGSNKVYPPVLKGNSGVVHIVEGGFDALSLIESKKMYEGKFEDTIIISGGANVSDFILENKKIQELLINANNIRIYRENEDNAEKQKKTDLAHDKQIHLIRELMKKNNKTELSDFSIEDIKPPKEFKDINDMHKAIKAEFKKEKNKTENSLKQ